MRLTMINFRSHGIKLIFVGALMIIVSSSWFIASLLANPFQPEHSSIKALMVNVVIIISGALVMVIGVWLRA